MKTAKTLKALICTEAEGTLSYWLSGYNLIVIMFYKMNCAERKKVWCIKDSDIILCPVNEKNTETTRILNEQN